MKKRKKFFLRISVEDSEDFPSDWDIYFSQLSEEEKQQYYIEDQKSVEEDYARIDFLSRVKNNLDYTDIVNKLIIKTDRGKGITAYKISKDFAMDQGNVRKYLIDLKEANLLLMNKNPKNGRMRHEYWLDEYRKRWFFEWIPWIGVDYEEEIEDILILLTERKLINPEYAITEKAEYRDCPSLSYDVGKTALSIIQEIERSIRLPTTDVEKFDVKELTRYGIAFNAIRDAIFRDHLKDVFGDKERIKQLNVFPYPRAYEFYEIEEFIEDAESLYERSENLIDRMFFREPEFIPKIKNGGNKT